MGFHLKRPGGKGEGGAAISCLTLFFCKERKNMKKNPGQRESSYLLPEVQVCPLWMPLHSKVFLEATIDFDPKNFRPKVA